MRYISFLALAALMVTGLFASTVAFSQKQGARSCEKATSTSAVIDCVNKKMQDAQDQMGDTFRSLMALQEEPQRQALSESQKSWILYRNAHCKWETGRSGTAALDRVYELSCIEQLTRMRDFVLKAAMSEEENATPREFSDKPRWMNVLAQNYPDIFWLFGERVSADLNCDGFEEKIMKGLSFSQIQGQKRNDKKGTPREFSLVIAISDNPETGIPKAVIHKFPIHEPDAEKISETPHVCNPSVKISVNMGADEETCQRTLIVDDGHCAPVVIGWDGATYTVVENESDEETL